MIWQFAKARRFILPTFALSLCASLLIGVVRTQPLSWDDEEAFLTKKLTACPALKIDGLMPGRGPGEGRAVGYAQIGKKLGTTITFVPAGRALSTPNPVCGALAWAPNAAGITAGSRPEDFKTWLKMTGFDGSAYLAACQSIVREDIATGYAYLCNMQP